MSLQDDWISIRSRFAEAFLIAADEYDFAAGEGMRFEIGSFSGVPANGIQLVCPEDTGGQVRLLMKVKIRAAQEILKHYPATLPVYSVRVTWPHPVASQTSPPPQLPPPPPITIPALPPTTPPSPNDNIYYV